MTTDNFLPDRLIKTSQTGGQQYSDTSPFSSTECHYAQCRLTECRSAFKTNQKMKDSETFIKLPYFFVFLADLTLFEKKNFLWNRSEFGAVLLEALRRLVNLPFCQTYILKT